MCAVYGNRLESDAILSKTLTVFVIEINVLVTIVIRSTDEIIMLEIYDYKLDYYLYCENKKTTFFRNNYYSDNVRVFYIYVLYMFYNYNYKYGFCNNVNFG